MKRDVRWFFLVLFLSVLFAGSNALPDYAHPVNKAEDINTAISREPDFPGHQMLDQAAIPDNSYERPAPFYRIVCFSRNIIISFIFKEIAFHKTCKNREFAVRIARSFFQSGKSRWGYYTVGLGKLRF